MRKFLIGILLVTAVAAGLPAHAAPGSVVVTVHSLFVPGDNDITLANTLFLEHGTQLQFVNLDLASHSVTSNTSGLFNSGIQAPGATVTIATQSLAVGTYAFHCAQHTTTMFGILSVVS